MEQQIEEHHIDFTNAGRLAIFLGSLLLLSAEGMAHVLRSGIVMIYITSYFPLIVLGDPLDPKRSYGPLPDTLCPGA